MRQVAIINRIRRLRPIEEFQAAYRSRLAQGNSLPHDVKGDLGISTFLEAPEGEVGEEAEEMSRWVDRVRSDLTPMRTIESA